MSINKRILLCLLLLLLVGGVSSHLIHQSPKYIAQKKEIEKQESQLVHDKDTKLPYTFLNNVIAQSGATSSVYYKSLDTGEVFYNFRERCQPEDSSALRCSGAPGCGERRQSVP